MQLKIRCPSGHVLAVPEQRAGQRVRCPVCEMTVKIPNEDAIHRARLKAAKKKAARKKKTNAPTTSAAKATPQPPAAPPIPREAAEPVAPPIQSKTGKPATPPATKPKRPPADRKKTPTPTKPPRRDKPTPTSPATTEAKAAPSSSEADKTTRWRLDAAHRQKRPVVKDRLAAEETPTSPKEQPPTTSTPVDKETATPKSKPQQEQSPKEPKSEVPEAQREPPPTKPTPADKNTEPSKQKPKLEKKTKAEQPEKLRVHDRPEAQPSQKPTSPRSESEEETKSPARKKEPDAPRKNVKSLQWKTGSKKPDQDQSASPKGKSRPPTLPKRKQHKSPPSLAKAKKKRHAEHDKPTPTPKADKRKSKDDRRKSKPDGQRPTPPPQPVAPEPKEEPQFRGVEYSRDRRWTIYYLGIALAAVALLSIYPAIMEVIAHFRAEDSPGIKLWASLVLLVGGVQLAYVIYLMQLPDWGTTKAMTIITALMATVYAAGLGIVMMAGEENKMIELLGLEYLHRKQYDKLWCFLIFLLCCLMTFLFFHVTAKWYKTHKISYAKNGDS